MLKAILLIVLILIALLIWLGFGVARIGAVSAGPKIAPRDGAALLLIDLQTVFWEHGPYSAEDKVTAQRAILAEIDIARSAGVPVIALRQEWSLPVTKVLARLTMKGQAVAGTAGTELATPFQGLVDHEIVKRVQDGFETGALDALLAQLGVGRLRIVGLDGQYCVAKTAQGALSRGYQVDLVLPGVLSSVPEKAQAALEAAEAGGAVLVR